MLFSFCRRKVLGQDKALLATVLGRLAEKSSLLEAQEEQVARLKEQLQAAQGVAIHNRPTTTKKQLACRAGVLVSTRWNPGRHRGLGNRESLGWVQQGDLGCGTEANRGKGWWSLFLHGASLQSRRISEHALESRPLSWLGNRESLGWVQKWDPMVAETIVWIYPLPTKNACFAG